MTISARLRRDGRGLVSLFTVLMGLAQLPLETARAQGPELTLRWQAPPPCPARAELLAEIRRLLGRAPRAESGLGMRVQARVHTQGTGFVLDLASEGGGRLERRQLRAAHCVDLAHATALIVALAIDPEAASAATAEPATEPPPAPPAASGLEGRGHLGAVFDSGGLPGASGGVVAGVGLRWRRLETETAILWLPRREAHGPGELSAQVQLAAAELRLCARLWGSTLALSLCGEGEVGRLIARGNGSVRAAQRDGSPWAAVGGGAWLRARLGAHFGLALGGGVLGVLTRPRIVVRAPTGEATTALYRPAAWTARAVLSGEVWF